MVSPAQRRTWVRWVQEAYAVSERMACDAGGVARSSVRYASVAAPQEPLRQRLRELAQTRIAYGYRRLHVLLCREGWPVNHKRVQRLYRDEGLTQQRKRPKRRRSAAARVVRVQPGAANECWAMDFIHDQLADGTAFRVLSIVDLYTRECVGLVPALRRRAEDVVATLSQLRDARHPRGHSVRQRRGVHVGHARSLVLLEPGARRLQSARQTDRQRGHRELPQQLPT